MSAPRMTPLKRIHKRLEERLTAPADATTEELVEVLLSCYDDLVRDARETRAARPPAEPRDYHRLPHWAAGVIGWHAPDGTTRVVPPGSAMPVIAPSPRPQPPAKPT